MKKIIKWTEGEGNIIAEYDGNLKGVINFSSDVINEGIDREQQVTVKASEKTETILVKQTGLREVFSASDGDFITSDETTFNTLKNGL